MPHFGLHMDAKSMCGAACFYMGYKKKLSRLPEAAGKLSRSERIKHKKEARSLHHSFNLRFRRGLERGWEGARRRMSQQQREKMTEGRKDKGRQNKRITKGRKTVYSSMEKCKSIILRQDTHRAKTLITHSTHTLPLTTHLKMWLCSSSEWLAVVFLSLSRCKFDWDNIKTRLFDFSAAQC